MRAVKLSTSFAAVALSVQLLWSEARVHKLRVRSLVRVDYEDFQESRRGPFTVTEMYSAAGYTISRSRGVVKQFNDTDLVVNKQKLSRFTGVAMLVVYKFSPVPMEVREQVTVSEDTVLMRLCRLYELPGVCESGKPVAGSLEPFHPDGHGIMTDTVAFGVSGGQKPPLSYRRVVVQKLFADGHHILTTEYEFRPGAGSLRILNTQTPTLGVHR